MSGDGSIYHVYESMDQATGQRLSAPYHTTEDGSIPPPNGYPGETYPNGEAYPNGYPAKGTYPSPAPDTLRSTPGYLMDSESIVDEPTPDYPMDSLQSGGNRDSQYDTNRWMRHVHDELHTTRWSHTIMSKGSVPYSPNGYSPNGAVPYSPNGSVPHAEEYSQRSDSPHSHYSREQDYLGYSEDEQEVAHNPLYGKSHDLFFAY